MFEIESATRQIDPIVTTFDSVDDLFDMSVDDVVGNEEESLFMMPIDEIPVNPFTGESILSQEVEFVEQLPINPWTGMEVEMPKKFDQAAAYDTFKKYYSQLESASKILAQHALVCTGADGHQKPAMEITDETFDYVQTVAFESIMNSELGEKMANQEELTEEDKQTLIEMTARTSDAILGLDTFSVIKELQEFEDFSWTDGVASRLIVEQANVGHIHSEACGHGGSVDVAGMTYAPMSFESTGGLYSAMNSGHEHHNKLVVCPHCSFKKVAHVHGSEGPKCGKCGKGKMKVSKKRS